MLRSFCHFVDKLLSLYTLRLIYIGVTVSCLVLSILRWHKCFLTRWWMKSFATSLWVERGRLKMLQRWDFWICKSTIDIHWCLYVHLSTSRRCFLYWVSRNKIVYTFSNRRTLRWIHLRYIFSWSSSWHRTKVPTLLEVSLRLREDSGCRMRPRSKFGSSVLVLSIRLYLQWLHVVLASYTLFNVSPMSSE